MTTTTPEATARSRTDVDDALVPVSGIMDARGSQAFIRVSGYRRSRDDVYVSPVHLRRYGLRTGDHVAGAARLAHRQDRQRQPGRTGQADHQRKEQKHNALDRVDAINGIAVGQAKARPDFDELTPLYPQERLRLEPGSGSATARIIDLVSPLGQGQRGLIVSAPKAGKTMVLAAIAAAVAAGHPQVHLMVVLVGERPEEVTDLKRSVCGEVIFSTFD